MLKANSMQQKLPGQLGKERKKVLSIDRPLTIFLHQYNILHVFDLIRTNEHNFNESELVKM